jgi:GNAT superfamily N-acetyltransferase
MQLKFHPATATRWHDLEVLFGKRGACAGCWCMFWRMKRSEWEKQRGDGTRKLLQKLTRSATAPGIIAYVDGEPAGWCSIGPRENFVLLENSRILKRVDDIPVWSVVCFFVARPFRRSGLTQKLLQAAMDYAKQKGVKIVEGYPIEPIKDHVPEIYAYTGFASVFRKAGFKEVARRSDKRPIMRKHL